MICKESPKYVIVFGCVCLYACLVDCAIVRVRVCGCVCVCVRVRVFACLVDWLVASLCCLPACLGIWLVAHCARVWLSGCVFARVCAH